MVRKRKLKVVNVSDENMYSPITCSLSVNIRELSLVSQTFFNKSAVEVAPKLLGKFLRCEDIVLKITEVEAYMEGDTACHARFGNNKRTAPLFGPGGHAYVYLCYGIHNMLNVTCDREGFGAGCLIRSCQPVFGVDTIMKRRATRLLPNLLNGPGKVGQALDLSVGWSHHPLYEAGGLELLEGPEEQFEILAGPRVGIDYAEEKDRLAKWRFAIGGTKYISSPRKGLLPMLPLE